MRFRSAIAFGHSFYIKVAVAGAALWLAPLPFNKALPVNGKTFLTLTEHLASNSEINTDEMAERPLFMAGRRPVRVAAPVRSAPRPLAIPIHSTEGIFLVGTILAASHSQALIRSGKPPSTVLVGPGQSIGPWKIDEIGIDYVRLQTGVQFAELKFSPPPNGKAGRRGTPMLPGWSPAPTPLFAR